MFESAKKGVAKIEKEFDGLAATEKTWKFNTRETVEDTVEFSLDGNQIKQDIQVQANTADGTTTFVQIDQIPQTKIFKQGSLAAVAQDLNQNSEGILDLLVVIDNSGSMGQEQTLLAPKLNKLLSYVSSSDYRIAVISTDANDQCVRTVINRTADAATQFSNAITSVGVNGSGNEEGFRMAHVGLTCDNSYWLRPDSKIAVLIVSDEDNCSNGNCSNPEGSAANLKKTLTDLGREPGKDARIYGIIAVPGITCNTAYNVGNKYQELITDTNGVSGSICAEDYSATLSSISQDVSTILDTRFALDSAPEQDTMLVNINGADTANGWTVEQQSIVFDPPPPQGALVKLRYQAKQPGAIISNFNLVQSPAEGSLRVYVNTTLINNYTVTNSQLMFTDPPPPASEIVASFKINPTKKSEFDIPTEAMNDSIKVYANDVLQEGYTLANGLANKKLTLAQAPDYGATIRVDYKIENGYQTTYPYTTASDINGQFKLYDKATESPIEFKLGSSSLIIEDQNQLKNVETIQLSWRRYDLGLIEVSLGGKPVLGSFEILAGPDECSDNLGIDDQKLTFNCDLEESTDFSVKYEYETVRKIFEISDVKDPDKGIWKVETDENEVLSWKREGSKFYFDDLPMNIEVRISRTDKR